jgi:hypothetical protein
VHWLAEARRELPLSHAVPKTLGAVSLKPLEPHVGLAFPSAVCALADCCSPVMEIPMSAADNACQTTDDDDLPVSITHARDTIIFAGRVEQDYRFLTYRFAGEGVEVEARMYLDDPWTVSVSLPVVGTAIPPQVLAYLQKRFNLVRQLGGPDGYNEIWSKPQAYG